MPRVIKTSLSENGLYDPKILNMLDAMPGLIEKEVNNKKLFIGKTLGLPDMLKEINQALNENRKEYYSIPQDRELIAQEFLLFENSGITDHTFSFDFSNRHIRDSDSPLDTSGVRQDEYQTAIRYQGDFANSAMHALAL